MQLSKEQLELFRHQLGSFDLSDVDLSEEEIDNCAAGAELFYRNYFKRILNKFYKEQLEFIGKKACDMEQLCYGRGTINGLLLIKEWFDSQVSSVRQKQIKDEKPYLGEL